MCPRCITYYLFTVSIIFQVAVRVDATDVDDAVKFCQSKEKKFAATENKYEKKRPRLPTEPELFQRPFIEEQQRKAYELELSQRTFECIADTLNEYSDDNLNSSQLYRNLVNECRSKQPSTPHCDSSYPYRLINGTCNNLLHPKWGSTFSSFRRLWSANYEGVSGLRKSVIGEEPLPNARDISRELITPLVKLSTDFNSLFAFFGQIVAHDAAQFPFTMINGSKRLECCLNPTGEDQHPQCAPIFINPTDVFYSAQNVHCFNVVRVIPFNTCSVGKRIQLNYVTTYIDCSLVYGQTEVRAQKLRKNDGSGKLKSQNRESGELLPPDESKGSSCGNIAKQEYCFETGDTRTDQQTPLMIFQTLLLREHNRVADKLKALNPDWDDEKLYQEARRILIAEFQVIIYKEYLPILLGPKLMSKYGLNIGNGSSYDSSLDPSISVEFNACAFRVHGILPGRVVFGEDVPLLQDLFLNAVPIYNDKMSSYLDEMANTAALKYDWFMPTDITIWINRELVGTWGFDLPALDIQRGRDTGIPTYVQVIENIENRSGTIKTFADLTTYIAPDCQIIFQKLYSDVRDIDLFAGIICEIIPDDMIISPTAADIIAEQFSRLKFADRFYFEHDKSLTDEQKKTLMNASLTKLICDNTDVEVLQPTAMLFPSDSNVPQLCSEIPGVDLQKWQE